MTGKQRQEKEDRVAEDAGLSLKDFFEVETLSGESILLEIVGISSFDEQNGGGIPSCSDYCEYVFTTKEVVDRVNGTENVFEVVFEFADCSQAGLFLDSIQEEVEKGGYLVSENH